MASSARDFDSTLQQVLGKYSPDIVLKNKQYDVLKTVFDTDSDVVASLPTGYGKSVIFHLLGRILAARDNREKYVTIVVTPLNVIQNDQLRVLHAKEISACKIDTKGNASALCSGESGELTSYTPSIREIMDSNFEILIVHPEGLLCSELGQALLDSRSFTENVVALVVDECHTVEQWGKTFRKAFDLLHMLPTYISCPIVALSATMTSSAISQLPKYLSMSKPVIIKISPDKPNIYIEKIEKPASFDIITCAETVYMPYVDELHLLGENFPVTLMYLPLEWMSWAQAELLSVFGCPILEQSLYCTMYSSQSDSVKNYVEKELKKENPKLRFLLCTSNVGMGFDSPSIVRVVHAKPPRTVVDLVQQVGRAGRRGQDAKCTIFYNNTDISSCVTGMSDDIRNFCKSKECLRKIVLNVFGFQPDETRDLQLCCSSCSNTVTGDNSSVIDFESLTVNDLFGI